MLILLLTNDPATLAKILGKSNKHIHTLVWNDFFFLFSLDEECLIIAWNVFKIPLLVKSHPVD